MRRFRSDEEPEKPNAHVYFADLWLGDPPRPGEGAGHHRFVWDLRYPAPPTLESEYSIAAVPGRPTPARPAGSFVLPGRYEVRLTAGGRSVSQPLEVAMDPRVATSAEDLENLLDFQRRVAATLERAVALAKEGDETAESVAGVLTSLASDLESVDAAPTRARRDLFAAESERLEAH